MVSNGKRKWRDFLKPKDDAANEWLEKIKQRFLGKLLVKIASEVFLALMIASATYFGTWLYHKITDGFEDIEKLNQIYISISNEYIETQFGTPYITVPDDNEFENNFYILNEAILRTVVDKDNKVIAFFITSTNARADIPTISSDNEKRVLGEVTYSDINFPNPQVSANMNMNGRYVYYGEFQGTGRYAMYNDYVYGYAPYGFFERNTSELINLVLFGNAEDEVRVQEYRRKAKPNTYGVVAEKYRESITMIPFCEEWENVFYLLDKHNEL